MNNLKYTVSKRTLKIASKALSFIKKPIGKALAIGLVAGISGSIFNAENTSFTTNIIGGVIASAIYYSTAFRHRDQSPSL